MPEIYNERSHGRQDAGELRVTSRPARTGRMQAENEIHTCFCTFSVRNRGEYTHRMY